MDCPDDEEWVLFASGLAAQEAREAVLAHASGRARCADRWLSVSAEGPEEAIPSRHLGHGPWAVGHERFRPPWAGRRANGSRPLAPGPFLDLFSPATGRKQALGFRGRRFPDGGRLRGRALDGPARTLHSSLIPRRPAFGGVHPRAGRMGRGFGSRTGGDRSRYSSSGVLVRTLPRNDRVGPVPRRCFLVRGAF